MIIKKIYNSITYKLIVYAFLLKGHAISITLESESVLLPLPQAPLPWDSFCGSNESPTAFLAPPDPGSIISVLIDWYWFFQTLTLPLGL